MRTKKWLAGTLTVLLLALALAGCGGGASSGASDQQASPPQSQAPSTQSQAASESKQTATPIEIEFWNYWDGANGEAIAALIEEFNAAHPDIRVKNVTFTWGELQPKLQAAIAGGTPPAAAAGDIAWMAKLHRSGALLSLDDAVAEAGVDLGDFYPALLEYSRYEGKLQSLPVSTNNLALFYNKDLFVQAGLNPDDPPETWAELRDAARKIAALGNGIQGFEIYTQAGTDGEGLTWQFQPYLWQSGADFLTDNYTKPGFNNEAGKKALQFLVDLIHVDKVTEPGQWGAFDKGQAGMRIDGSWMVSSYAEQSPFDFGVAMLPIPEGGQHATNMGGEQVFVFKTTPEQEEAATEFVLWLTSTPVQVKWDTLTSFMPIRKSVANDSTYREWLNNEPRLIPFVEQQQYAHARPPIPEYPDTSLAFAQEVEKAFFGQISVDEALANAEKAINEILAK